MNRMLILIFVLIVLLGSNCKGQMTKEFYPLSKFKNDTIAYIKANYSEVNTRNTERETKFFFEDSDSQLPVKSFYMIDNDGLSYIVMLFYSPEEIKRKLENKEEIYGITCVFNSFISPRINEKIYSFLKVKGFKKIHKMDTTFRKLIENLVLSYVIYEEVSWSLAKILKTNNSK